ncbi:MAG: GNAT family N-acetyltransferase [Parvularculaceae bacterium]
MSDNALTLLTERLILRPPTMDDFAVHAANQADPDVMRYIAGEPVGEEDAWRRFMSAVGHWALFGYGFWAVEERASGRVFGEVGFINARREIRTGDHDAEMGWLLGPAGQGKGYALEAGRAVMNWGRAHLDAERFTALISPENAASIRLAERLGFALERQAAYKNKPTNIYVCPFERLASD